MAPLSQRSRSTNSPSPIYGIRPGFTVGDLDRSYTPPIPVFGTPVTYPAGTTQPNWDHGTVVPFSIAISASTATAINTNARAVRISVNVNGTGSISLAVTTAADAFAVPIAIYNNLTAGGYQFYLGGYGNSAEFSYDGESQVDNLSNTPNPSIETSQSGINAVGTTSSPTSDGSSYIGGLVQYGPVGAISQVTSGSTQNKGGFDPARSNVAGLNPGTDNNFFGQTYNPFQFLSLDGYALKFAATVTGSVGYDVEVSPIS